MKKLIIVILALCMQSGALFAQNLYDSLIVFTMELDSVVVTAKNKGYYKKLSKQQKIDIVTRFKAKVSEDFPDKNEEHRILTTFKIAYDDMVMITAEMEGNMAVFPKVIKGKKDSIFFESIRESAYVNDKVTGKMEKMEELVASAETNNKKKGKKEENDEEQVDNAIEQIWGNSPNTIVSPLTDDPKKWDYIDNGDGTALLVYRMKFGFLGILKSDTRINFLVNSSTLQLLSIVQEEFMGFKIPFGGSKIEGEELEMMNSMRPAGQEFDSFKMKRTDMYTKQLANYEDKEPTYKAVEYIVKMIGDEEKTLSISVHGSAKVLDK